MTRNLHHVFACEGAGRSEDGYKNLVHLAILGMLISVLGQFGDLMLSSIKRDLGIKDMAATIPGHGGLLDRFDSIILVAPAVFHYINYFVGVGKNQVSNILTGS